MFSCIQNDGRNKGEETNSGRELTGNTDFSLSLFAMENRSSERLLITKPDVWGVSPRIEGMKSIMSEEDIGSMPVETPPKSISHPSALRESYEAVSSTDFRRDDE